MGCPLRKLHQIHLIVPVPTVLPNSCNNRTTTGSGGDPPPKHMEAQGFVSKKERLEKPDHQRLAVEVGLRRYYDT
jgi:hypothetical protein